MQSFRDTVLKNDHPFSTELWWCSCLWVTHAPIINTSPTSLKVNQIRPIRIDLGELFLWSAVASLFGVNRCLLISPQEKSLTAIFLLFHFCSDFLRLWTLLHWKSYTTNWFAPFSIMWEKTQQEGEISKEKGFQCCGLDTVCPLKCWTFKPQHVKRRWSLKDRSRFGPRVPSEVIHVVLRTA